jgi:hypothetical protein
LRVFDYAAAKLPDQKMVAEAAKPPAAGAFVCRQSEINFAATAF